jgi:hypothetical protein
MPLPSFQFRPKYVSCDCDGTLVERPMTPITRELLGDQIPAEQWDQFVREFRGYRYDQVRGEYYPYEQVLQDSFERVCRKEAPYPSVLRLPESRASPTASGSRRLRRTSHGVRNPRNVTCFRVVKPSRS